MVVVGMCAFITLPRFPITVTHDSIRTLKRSIFIRSPTTVVVLGVGVSIFTSRVFLMNGTKLLLLAIGVERGSFVTLLNL